MSAVKRAKGGPESSKVMVRSLDDSAFFIRWWCSVH
jgi:hypothetical protein